MRITIGHPFGVRVLKMDRPDGRRVLKFDGAFGPEGCGIALSGDEYEVSVTDLPFCIIRHEKHYGNQPPPVASFSPLWCLTAPPFPRKRGHYKASLCCERLIKGLLCGALLSHRSAVARELDSQGVVDD